MIVNEAQVIDIWRSSTDVCPTEPLKNSGYVVLLRHGHGTHISEGFFNASIDGLRQARLTSQGKAQVVDAAKKIRLLMVEPLFAFVSPLTRTLETFQILREMAVPVNGIKEELAVIEAGTGPHEGEAFDSVIANDYDNRNPTLWKGETITSLEKRVLAFVKTHLLPLLELQNALIVTHQAVINAFEPESQNSEPAEIRVYSSRYLKSWIAKTEMLHAKLNI